MGLRHKKNKRSWARKNKRDNSEGFTMIELLIVITIAGILASLAMPSFTNLIRDTRLSTTANSILSSLTYARSEAVKRNRAVSVEKKGQWSSGWDVVAGGEVIRTHTNIEELNHD